MCAIAGCIEPGIDRQELVTSISRMLDAQSHRGPDDRGVWVDAQRGVGLGHCRLSIQDLTEAGHQPMLTDDGQIVLSFNGELYNAPRLRQRIAVTRGWRGASDTEVLLRAIENWGLADTLSQAKGMFALAVWNGRDRRLTLVRDRLGIKPLYYSIQNGRVLWASELKALLRDPRFDAQIDPTALQLFLRFGYVPAPHCILQRTWKLRPGTWIELDPKHPADATSHVYWDAGSAARDARRDSGDSSDEQYIEQTDQLLKQLVAEHLAGDVPMGAFLSGGIDSSLIAAVMQTCSSTPVRTYAIGFDEPEFDEAPFARRVAAWLGTEHQEHYVSENQVARYVPQWASHYCEPFSDTSGLPSLIVCRYARQDIKVALTGDGGDELFAGYRRYQQAMQIQQRMRYWPHSVRKALSDILAVPSSSAYHRLQCFQDVFAGSLNEGLAETVRKTRSLLSASSARELYECLASISYDANRYGVIKSSRATPDTETSNVALTDAWAGGWEFLHNMQLWDSQVYLPNDILHKVDIASMAVGLEVRVPLLDHRMFQHAWRIPDRLKFDRHRGKLLLRRVLSRYVPEHLFDRPKRGFSAPLDSWLRGPLRDWAEGLIERRTLEDTGLFDSKIVLNYWDDLIHRRAGHARIWPILVFLAWQQRYLTASPYEDCVRDSSSDSLRIGG